MQLWWSRKCIVLDWDKDLLIITCAGHSVPWGCFLSWQTVVVAMHLFSQNIGRLERKHHINGEVFSSWVTHKLNVIIIFFFWSFCMVQKCTILKDENEACSWVLGWTGPSWLWIPGLCAPLLFLFPSYFTNLPSSQFCWELFHADMNLSPCRLVTAVDKEGWVTEGGCKWAPINTACESPVEELVNSLHLLGSSAFSWFP